MHPQRTGDWLREQLAGASELTVVSPFITEAGLSGILDVVAEEARIVVYTRWHAAEVASGVSETGIWDLVRARDGVIFLHPLLHAKVYCGDRVAFVGSANASRGGLGWARMASVELLVGVGREEPHLVQLIELLSRTSARATAMIREEIDRRAEELTPDAVVQDESEMPGGPEDVAGGLEEIEGGGYQVGIGVPRYRMPEAVWAAYCGYREPEIRGMVLRDLAALGVQLGMGDRSGFYAAVGSALLQGFSGKLIQSLRGLPAVTAAQKYAHMREEAGVPVNVEDLEGDYRALVRWVNEFVPNAPIVPSGYSIS